MTALSCRQWTMRSPMGQRVLQPIRLLVKRSLYKYPDQWRPLLADMSRTQKGAQKAEEIARRITIAIAGKFEPIFFRATGGAQGYVCAPGRSRPGRKRRRDAGQWPRRPACMGAQYCRQASRDGSRTRSSENLHRRSMTIVATASFTVPQVLAVARRHMVGLARASANGRSGGPLFSQ